MEYFTEKDIEEAVSQALMSSDFKILKFKSEKLELENIPNMGNHYQLAVDVMHSNKEHVLHLFVKLLPDTKDHRSYVLESDFFYKEAHFYICIAPQMNKLLPSELPLPVPVCYFAKGGSTDHSSPHYCSNPEESIIVLEDLHSLGYSMSNKWKPLDLPHCQLVLKALANFHGGSFLLQQPEKPHLPNSIDDDSNESVRLDLKSIKESVFVDDVNYLGNRICRVAAESTAAVMIKLWPSRFGSDKDYTRILDSIWSSWQSVFFIVRSSSKYSNVVCHGDPWFSNLMFAYDKDIYGDVKPIDVKLVDLQLYRFAPPATDVLFFIYVCTRRAFRDQHLPEFLTHYYKELERVASPSLLNNFLTRSSLQESVREMKIFGVMIGMFLIPILLDRQDKSDAAANVGRLGGKSKVMEFLLKDRSEQIFKNINEYPECKERIVEIYQEYLEFAGLWDK